MSTTSSSTNSVPAKRPLPAHTSESPAKKQSKWSAEEDALIIDLRGSGMKWEDISKRLPGRSAISCRLHYQNYLERRSEWDEDRKNKLARLYERCASVWYPKQILCSRTNAGTDSNRICGPRLQRRCRFHGVLQRRCTGSWGSMKWPDVLESYLSHCRTTPAPSSISRRRVSEVQEAMLDHGPDESLWRNRALHNYHRSRS